MARWVARIVIAPAIYGFSVGAVYSWRYALLNTIKFPMLIAVVALVCSVAHYVIARFFGVPLTFADVRRLVFEGYGDLGVLLASLSTVLLFFALTFEPAISATELGEYPWFLGLNVALIAGLGALSLGRQARGVVRRAQVSRGRASLVVGGWLAASLFVGAQGAWYLRPFFGNRAVPDDGSFCLGSRPDFRGATSFFEAVGDLLGGRGAVASRWGGARGEEQAADVP